MTKTRGNKSSKPVIEQRTANALELLNQGATQTAVATNLGVNRTTLWRNLRELTQKLATQNLEAHETRVAAQEAVLELIEQALLEGQVEVEVANAWRQVRADIAKLRGLNAESRSVIAHVSTNQDVEYLKFKSAIADLTDDQVQDVFDYAKKLPRQPRTVIRDASWFPPVEPKQLPEGETK